MKKYTTFHEADSKEVRMLFIRLVLQVQPNMQIEHFCRVRLQYTILHMPFKLFEFQLEFRQLERADES